MSTGPVIVDSTSKQVVSPSAGIIFPTSITAGLASTLTGSFVLKHASHAFGATFTQSASQSGATAYVLPVALPASDKILQCTSAGVLSWVTATAGGNLDVGTTQIDNGGDTRVLFQDGTTLSAIAGFTCTSGGDVTAASFTGDGSGLTGVTTADPLSVGTLTVTTSVDFSGVTGQVTIQPDTASQMDNMAIGQVIPLFGGFTTVGVSDPTTPAITLVQGSTNTGYVLINGKTSGSLKITTADATAQAVTLTVAAQTVGAATVTIPNCDNVSKTVCISATSVTATEAMFATTTAGAPAFRAVADTDLPATMTVARTLTSAAPQLTLGVNTTTLGSVKLFGNTSGDLTIRPAAIAGTASVATFPAVIGTVAVAATSTTTTQALFATATAGAPAFRAIAATDVPHSITFALSGGGSALTTGVKDFILNAKDAGTITGWSMSVSPADTITVDILRSADGGAAPSASIVGAGTKPAIASGVNAHNTPASWTSTTISAYDNFKIQITAVGGTATAATLTLYYA